MIGKRFGKLVVVERAGVDKWQKTEWLCKCDCGNEKIIKRSNLGRNVNSCGCLLKEMMINKKTTHGYSDTRLYNIWCGVKGRCLREKDPAFEGYGGRGIKICSDWEKDYLFFHNWALNNGYEDSLTLERKDVNGNYEPENCKWIPKGKQALNVRRNIKIEYRGKEYVLSEFCRVFNLKYGRTYYRYKAGKRGDELIK